MKNNDNILQMNDSSWDILSIITNSREQEKDVVAWRLISGEKETLEVKMRVIRKGKREIAIVAKDPSQSGDLVALATGAKTMNFYLPDDLVLFQTLIKNYDHEGEVIVELPKAIAHIDRRKYMRLKTNVEDNPDHVISTEFFKSNNLPNSKAIRFCKPCFDLSAGGLSFVISRSESPYFQIGDHIFNMNVRVEHKEILVAGEIVNIYDVEPDERNKLNYRGKKICVHYTVITEEERRHLDNYVFKHIEIDEKVS